MWKHLDDGGLLCPCCAAEESSAARFMGLSDTRADAHPTPGDACDCGAVFPAPATDGAASMPTSLVFPVDLSAADFIAEMGADSLAEALATFAARTMADTLACVGRPMPAGRVPGAAMHPNGRAWSPCVREVEPGLRPPPDATCPDAFIDLLR